MKLLQPNAATICNCELLQVLAERGADGSGKALIVERMAYQYLASQPVHPLSAKQLQEFFDALKPYNLSRGELMQLANLGPRSPVEVHLLVADCDSRLGDEGVEAVLAAVAQRVAREDEAAAGAAGDGGNGSDANAMTE
ncbi:hypothetical protein PLESTB_000984100 [Pleodorina starrii]|uniref:DNA-directed RNA polymerase III subunit RPC9 n=1 Tax=Pleodorina starrii TaxID=330485 RepID=A0A9W6F3T6_9CHLO|nr:hypothetical protein PLESTM_000546700 [Pleodorina starrii]GLC55407.1 hypothetical protein PLESTB_000984100 [Pleodorina starrii]GLC73802.1 hypothetical protein PLESTF_001422700 [Pleodorina starrii]